jgi:hypothetical protein
MHCSNGSCRNAGLTSGKSPRETRGVPEVVSQPTDGSHYYGAEVYDLCIDCLFSSVHLDCVHHCQDKDEKTGEVHEKEATSQEVNGGGNH